MRNGSQYSQSIAHQENNQEIEVTDNASTRGENLLAAFWYIEEMNNGRYYVSCGDEKSCDSYWYMTTDTEQEAIDCLLEQDKDPDVLETFGVIKVSEIYIVQNWMFHDRNLKYLAALRK